MLNNRFDKFMISVYTKKKMEDEDYEKIKLAFKESGKPEEILKREFSEFKTIKFNERINRLCIFFEGTDEFSYDSYIKVFRVEKL